MTWMIVELGTHNTEWDDDTVESKRAALCKFLKENKVEYGSFNEGFFDQAVIINLDPDTDYRKIAKFITKNLQSNPTAIHLLWRMEAINGAGEPEVMIEALEDEILETLGMPQTSIDEWKRIQDRALGL